MKKIMSIAGMAGLALLVVGCVAYEDQYYHSGRLREPMYDRAPSPHMELDHYSAHSHYEPEHKTKYEDKSHDFSASRDGAEFLKTKSLEDKKKRNYESDNTKSVKGKKMTARESAEFMKRLPDEKKTHIYNVEDNKKSETKNNKPAVSKDKKAETTSKVTKPSKTTKDSTEMMKYIPDGKKTRKY